MDYPAPEHTADDVGLWFFGFRLAPRQSTAMGLITGGCGTVVTTAPGGGILT